MITAVLAGYKEIPFTIHVHELDFRFSFCLCVTALIDISADDFSVRVKHFKQTTESVHLSPATRYVRAHLINLRHRYLNTNESRVIRPNEFAVSIAAAKQWKSHKKTKQNTYTNRCPFDNAIMKITVHKITGTILTWHAHTRRPYIRH